MASNFDFLQTHFPDLHQHATHAESLVHADPRASCFYARFALEQAVIWLYDNDPYLQLPYDKNLAALLHEQTFKDNLKPGLFPKIRTIQKIGNLAVHSSNAISSRDALQLDCAPRTGIANRELFHFLYWLCRYYAPDGRHLLALNFDCAPRTGIANRALIPQANREASQELSQQQLKQLEEQLSQTEKLQRLQEKRRQQTEEQLKALQAEIAALKQQNDRQQDRHDYNEADTRRYQIDVLLKEAGWNPELPGYTEVQVTGMPNESGTGYVDYVLWGDDGKPLALVEAKRTSKSPEAGKYQAELYANCLENQYNQRPIIFYSNGYETWLWDDQNYPPRSVQGFLKKDELQRLIFRRTSRKKLHLIQVNSEIIARPYQQEAIRRIGETFQKKGRKALLVMATGTGKTRTAIGNACGRRPIALIDLMMRANWVKRTLFLADWLRSVRGAQSQNPGQTSQERPKKTPPHRHPHQPPRRKKYR